MKEAISVGEMGLSKGEVPVGCVIVNNKRNIVIAKSHNLTNLNECALRHAEFECLRIIWEKYKSLKVLYNCTLYVTCEPCVFCATALIYCGIDVIYFGCRNPRFGGCGSIVDLKRINNFNHFKFYEGLLENDCLQLLKRFYNKGNPKTKKK